MAKTSSEQYILQRDRRTIGTYNSFVDAWLDAYLGQCYAVIVDQNGRQWTVNPPKTN